MERDESDPRPRAVPAVEPAFGVDELIAGRYRVRRYLGRGTSGEVYAVADLELGTEIALKALRPAFGDAEFKGMRGGMHVSLRLPPRFGDAREIERRAAARGVGVYVPGSGGAFVTPGNPRARDTLLFGYAALSERSIAIAAGRLAQAVAEGADGAKDAADG